jgi:hypothetical protein
VNRDRETKDPIEVAQQWLNQAGVLRRRAARLADPLEKQEALDRADWFERRARIVEAAYPAPPIFPPELRTPIDRLDLVDDLRRHLAELLVLGGSIENGEIAGFVDAVARARGPRLDTARASKLLLELLGLAVDLAGELGVDTSGPDDVFADYAIKLVDGDAGDGELEADADASAP